MKYIVRRACRMIPVIVAVISLTFLTPLMGYGQHWNDNIGKHVDNCKVHWLPTVFFFGNWIKHDNMCVNQAWHISMDFQMTIIGSFFVYLLYRFPKLGVKACVAGILMLYLWLAIVVYVYDLLPALIWDSFDTRYRDLMLELTYLGVVPHLSSYLLGLLTSYMLHRNFKLRLGKLQIYTGWTLSSFTMFYLLLKTSSAWQTGYWPNAMAAALYQVAAKMLWVFSVCWYIYQCATGHGGIMNSFLSWSGFSWLSKLSFSMSMINILLIKLKNSLLRRYIYFSLSDILYDFWGHYVSSIAIGALLYLMVESPFASLVDHYLKEKVNKVENKKKERKE